MTDRWKLPPRYELVLNTSPQVRFSVCPECGQRTLVRKVPLFVHVEPRIPVMLNKVCRYCPECDFLIIHQDELENWLAIALETQAPEATGIAYRVLGTFDKSTWRQRQKNPIVVGNLAEYLHPFKGERQVMYTPAHWGPAEPEPSFPEDLPEPPIDDRDQVESLLAKMEAYTPIPAEIGRAQARGLRAQGVPIPPHRQVHIYEVLDGSDEGGILCGLSPAGSTEPLVMSLTSLKVPYHHPLSKEIRAYQKARLSKLNP
jgi:hypothetical protein